MILELDSFKMLEKDLGGYQAVLSFGDYELSIISGDGAYGTKNAPYEIGVFKHGQMIEMPGITEGDDTVKGYLTTTDVDTIIKKMYFLTGVSPRQL
jgi:hypothetical protein